MSPRPLHEYLLAGLPGLAVVERDLLYARRIVQDALQAEMTDRPFLEWTISQGWRGSQDLIQRSGLPETEPIGPKDVYDLTNLAPRVVGSLAGWVRQVPRVGETHAFTSGVMVFHDLLDPTTGTAWLARTVAELCEGMSMLRATVVFMIPAPLHAGHPLRGVVVEAHGHVDLVSRYGRLIQRFLKQLTQRDPEPQWVRWLTALFDGLTQVEAEGVVRLVLMDHTFKAQATTLQELAQRLKDEADLVRAARRGTGADLPTVEIPPMPPAEKVPAES